MKKLSFRIIDRHTIALNEVGNIGDQIDLNEKIDLDLSSLSDALNQMISDKLKAQHNEDVHNFRLQSEELKKQIKTQLDAEQHNLLVAKDNAYQSQINQLKSQYIEQINLLHQQQAQKINDLNDNIIRLKNENNEQLLKKQKIIDELERQHNNKVTKEIGEDLEQWCFHQFQQVQSYGGFKGCKLIKDNILVANELDPNSTKADFIFEVYDLNDVEQKKPLVSVCCEMKSKVLNAKTTRKFIEPSELKKLDADRVKKGCDEALMISEREMENNILFQQINEYEHMYIIRPEIFLTVLNIYAGIYQKYASTIKKINDDKLAFSEQFATKKTLIERLEKFKTSIFSECERVSKYLQNNNHEAENIIKCANKIKENNETTILNSLNKIMNRINKFNFNKFDDSEFSEDEPQQQ